MEMESLITVCSIGFRISIGVFILGLALAAFSYWKLNIKDVYLIRSGKAKRRSIGQLEAHNRETGKLRDSLDLDFTTGNLKKTGKRLRGNTEKTTEEASPFKKSSHSGNTGKFSTSAPTLPPETKKSEGDESKSVKSIIVEPEKTEEYKIQIPEAPISGNAGETVQLDRIKEDSYAERISSAYQPMETGDLSKTAAIPAIHSESVPAEPSVPVNIISRELIIHTNEIIEI